MNYKITPDDLSTEDLFDILKKEKQLILSSAAADLKQLNTPVSIDYIPSSNEQEDHVSMCANGATRLLRVADNLTRLLTLSFLQLFRHSICGNH